MATSRPLKYRPRVDPSYDDGDQGALQRPPTAPDGQFDDAIPVRPPDHAYTGTRRIGVFVEGDTLRRHRGILRAAILHTGRTLEEFTAVIPELTDWLAGETPIGAHQRFYAACLCDTLCIPLHSAFPDLRVDYHA